MDAILHILIFAAAGCAVFGIASGISVAQIPSVAQQGAPSLRRGGSNLTQFFSSIGSRLLPRRDKERHELKLTLLQAGFYAPNAAEAYCGLRITFALAMLAVLTPIL